MLGNTSRYVLLGLLSLGAVGCGGGAENYSLYDPAIHAQADLGEVSLPASDDGVRVFSVDFAPKGYMINSGDTIWLPPGPHLLEIGYSESRVSITLSSLSATNAAARVVLLNVEPGGKYRVVTAIGEAESETMRSRTFATGDSLVTVINSQARSSWKVDVVNARSGQSAATILDQALSEVARRVRSHTGGAIDPDAMGLCLRRLELDMPGAQKPGLQGLQILVGQACVHLCLGQRDKAATLLAQAITESNALEPQSVRQADQQNTAERWRSLKDMLARAQKHLGTP